VFITADCMIRSNIAIMKVVISDLSPLLKIFYSVNIQSM